MSLVQASRIHTRCSRDAFMHAHLGYMYACVALFDRMFRANEV